MEPLPAASSDESLWPPTTMLSATSSRATSRSPSKRSSARKFSLAVRLRSSSETSHSHGTRPGKSRNSTDEELISLMGKIPNTQATQDRKTLRERAQEQLESIDKEYLPQVLEEYTRIPHTILPIEMLLVRLETRVKIIDSVAKAKAAMITKIYAEYEREDRQRLEFSTRKAHVEVVKVCMPTASQQLESPTTCVDSVPLTNVKNDSSRLSQPQSHEEEAARVDADDLRRSTESECTVVSDSSTEVDSAPSPMSSRTNTLEETPNPSRKQSVVGSKYASRDNPFASFINERSDADAERLPNDLMLCYFAHNQVQDRLRSIWRLRKQSGSAEQVAMEVWKQLPQREYEVSKEFEGRLGLRRALTMDQLVYVWVSRFWQRCQNEEW